MCLPALGAAVPAIVASITAVGSSLAPIAMGVGAAASIAGTGVAIAGAVQSAEAAEDQGKYQQKMALYDAVAKKNQGQIEQVKLGIAQRREFGSARAAAAASSVDLSYGSTHRILSETRKFHAMDGLLLAENVRSSVLSAKTFGDVARYNGNVQAQNFRFQAAGAGLKGLTNFGLLAAASQRTTGDTDPGSGFSPISGASSRRVTSYGPL